MQKDHTNELSELDLELVTAGKDQGDDDGGGAGDLLGSIADGLSGIGGRGAGRGAARAAGAGRAAGGAARGAGAMKNLGTLRTLARFGT
jgi:hypothetical protein